MNAKKCDVCGKLYENYVENHEDDRPNKITFINDRIIGCQEICSLDLCEGCMEKVKDVLNIKDLAD